MTAGSIGKNSPPVSGALIKNSAAKKFTFEKPTQSFNEVNDPDVGSRSPAGLGKANSGLPPAKGGTKEGMSAANSALKNLSPKKFMGDTFEIMALFLEVLQERRTTARISKQIQLNAQVKELFAEADSLKDSGWWNFGATLASSGMSAIGSGIALKSAANAATAGNKVMDAAKQPNTPAVDTPATKTSLGTEVSKTTTPGSDSNSSSPAAKVVEASRTPEHQQAVLKKESASTTTADTVVDVEVAKAQQGSVDQQTTSVVQEQLNTATTDVNKTTTPAGQTAHGATETPASTSGSANVKDSAATDQTTANQDASKANTTKQDQTEASKEVTQATQEAAPSSDPSELSNVDKKLLTEQLKHANKEAEKGSAVGQLFNQGGALGQAGLKAHATEVEAKRSLHGAAAKTLEASVGESSELSQRSQEFLQEVQRTMAKVQEILIETDKLINSRLV